MSRWSLTQHPAAVGESYAEHMAVAFRFGCRLLLASLACLIHGVLPFLFTTTGSSTVRTLHDDMVTHRRRAPAAAAAEAIR